MWEWRLNLVRVTGDRVVLDTEPGAVLLEVRQLHDQAVKLTDLVGHVVGLDLAGDVIDGEVLGGLDHSTHGVQFAFDQEKAL